MTPKPGDGVERGGAREAFERAGYMLQAYVECIKAEGSYERWHYIPEVEDLISDLAALSHVCRTDAAQRERPMTVLDRAATIYGMRHGPLDHLSDEQMVRIQAVFDEAAQGRSER